MIPEQHSVAFYPVVDVTVHKDCQDSKHHDHGDGHVSQKVAREKTNGTGCQNEGEEIPTPVTAGDMGQKGFLVLYTVIENVHKRHQK